jgi:hypothetical protein
MTGILLEKWKVSWCRATTPNLQEKEIASPNLGVIGAILCLQNLPNLRQGMLHTLFKVQQVATPIERAGYNPVMV